MRIRSFYDRNTATFTHVVSDEATRRAAVIDPVLDYDLETQKISTPHADEVMAYIQAERLTLEWILETHVHADHLTAASYIKQKLGGKIGIGHKIIDVLKYWVPKFDVAEPIPVDGSQFDKLFVEDEMFRIGSLEARVKYTPGHTPDGITYVIGDAAFMGDTLFMPHGGTARADFPGGNAATLYQSIQKIFALPDTTRLFACHDYPPQGEEPSCESTVAKQKKNNTMIGAQKPEPEYVATRQKRDSILTPPKLLYPSLQVNMRAGYLPSYDTKMSFPAAQA